MGVFVQNRKRAVPLGPLRAFARKLLQKLGRPEAELGLVLVDDRRIRRLNRKYRGLDSPTDVLAFPLSLDPNQIKSQGRPTPPPLLGDVVISLETARRQAKEAGQGLYDEVRRLLIHGTLHLLGHDHAQPREARRMRRKERELSRGLL